MGNEPNRIEWKQQVVPRTNALIKNVFAYFAVQIPPLYPIRAYTVHRYTIGQHKLTCASRKICHKFIIFN